MRLPTLGDIVSTAQRNLKRFPLVILAGAVTAYGGLAMIEGSMGDERFTRLMAAASLGLPLFFGLAVLAERRAASVAGYWMAQAAGVVILGAFWWAWPAWTLDIRGARFLQMAIAFHLFVAIAPFIGRDEPQAFWQYNRILFIRFLLTAFYTAVLWLGLSGALVALDKLLGVDVAGEAYGRLWILLTFVFNPWFFVSGVPEDIAALNDVDEYPRGLRAFTQYVLVPIVALYLAILTAYLVKVLVTQEWPRGWIGYLVSSVSAVGILSWLLVRPLEDKPEHAWVKAFTRGFYVAMMPAIVMLWLAIWARVHQYGITERRYFLIVLSVWFAAIAVYYTISRSRNIKVIPATLCAIALVSFAGPWGAYARSQASQRHRLEVVLARHGMLENGVLRRPATAVPDSSVQEIGEGFRYLLQVHGVDAVRPMLTGDVARAAGAIGSGTHDRAESGARSIMRAVGLTYIGRRDGTSSFRAYYADRTTRPVRIEGYTYAMSISPQLSGDSVDVAAGIRMTLKTAPPAIVLVRGTEPVLTLSLQPAVDLATNRGMAPGGREPIVLEAHSGPYGALVALTQLTGTVTRGGFSFTGLAGNVYVRVP